MEKSERISEVISRTKSLLFRKFQHILDERFYFKNEVTRDKVVHAIIESYREPQSIWLTGPFCSGKSTLARFIQNTGKNFIIIEEETRQNFQSTDLFSREGRGMIIVGQNYRKSTDPSRIIEMVTVPNDYQLLGSLDQTMLCEIQREEVESLLSIFKLYIGDE